MPDEAIAVDENAVSFEAFKEEWLAEVREGAPSTVELGRRFAWKIVQNRFNLGQNDDEEEEGVFYCDGSNDGGIDLAYLDRGDAPTPDDAATGHVWYLVQSKYGQSYQGPQTLLAESLKVFDALDGSNTKLSSLSQTVVEMLRSFKQNAGEQDRIVLLFATENPIDDPSARSMLDDVRLIGRRRVGDLFDIETVSLKNIYRDASEIVEQERVMQVPLKGELALSVDGRMFAGTVAINDMYEFLRAFIAKTGDLDGLYEKNVRQFLRSRSSVNQAMSKTLIEDPELFGLFNNGVTIVAQNAEVQGDAKDKHYVLTNPFVVNGCQTTRTIYETLKFKLQAGGSKANDNSIFTDWEARLKRGVVVVKIVKVGEKGGEKLLNDITRNTNRQNAVRERDFMALHPKLRTWAKAMDTNYNVFLELQGGGWDAQKALQKQKPKMKQYSRHATSLELLKVYGAGWLCQPGLAFLQNSAFMAPKGSVFTQIVEPSNGVEPFGPDDLYAAYLLQQQSAKYGFGRGAKESSHRLTRYLFQFVSMELLRRIVNTSEWGSGAKALTRAFLVLSEDPNLPLRDEVTDSADQLIREYLNDKKTVNIFDEPQYKEQNDLNAFLKSKKLGADLDYSPKLKELLKVYETLFDRTKTSLKIVEALQLEMLYNKS